MGGMTPTPELASREKMTSSGLSGLVTFHVANNVLCWISCLLKEEETLGKDKHVLKYCICQKQIWLGAENAEKFKRNTLF